MSIYKVLKGLQSGAGITKWGKEITKWDRDYKVVQYNLFIGLHVLDRGQNLLKNYILNVAWSIINNRLSNLVFIFFRLLLERLVGLKKVKLALPNLHIVILIFSTCT